MYRLPIVFNMNIFFQFETVAQDTDTPKRFAFSSGISAFRLCFWYKRFFYFLRVCTNLAPLWHCLLDSLVAHQ